MYVRFVSTALDEHTGRPLGVFHAAYEVRDAFDTPHYYEAILREHLSWFNANLHVPTQFSRSRIADARPIALCWFKPSATKCIGRAREIASIVNELAFPVSMITSRRPGMVVYEDGLQIAAVPFRR